MRATILVVAILSLTACGGDTPGGGGAGSGGAGGAGGMGGAGGGTAQPGKVTVVANVSGAAGKVLVVFAYPPGGNVGMAAAGLCAPIMADPASVTDTVKARKAGAMTPCDLETAAKVFDPGPLNLTLMTFTPMSMTPERCAQTVVQVDGDKTVAAPALGSCM